MGVSCILVWKPPEGLNPSQALDLLQKRLEKLGGKSLGTWTVDCETLQSTPALATGITKQVHILHSSEYPKTTFAVLDSMKCLVADNSFDTIFAHLKSFYTPRKAQKIEAKGFYYELRQYVVKFGSIVTGSTNRGIVVEVEDTEHSTVRTCWETLTTFVKGLLESSKTIEPPNFSSDKPYVPADSITNYAYIFGELRKTTTKLS